MITCEMRKTMKINKLSLLLLGLLAGCSSPEITDWTPAESPHENKVDRAIFTHKIHYPAHASTWGAHEKKSFLHFLKHTAPRPFAVTVILEEYGGHSEERIKVIQRELLRHGVPSDVIMVTHEDDSPGGHTHKRGHHQKQGTPEATGHKHHGHAESGSGVEVIIERYVVITPSCANFLKSFGDADQAYDYANFGCADAVNLGMMVANPRDLIQGRPLGGAEGVMAAAAVNRYHSDKVKDLLQTSTNVTLSQQPSSAPSSSSGSTTGGATAPGSGSGY